MGYDPTSVPHKSVKWYLSLRGSPTYQTSFLNWALLLGLGTYHWCKTPTLLNVFFLILSGWRGFKGNFKKISVPMTLNWYLEDNGRFK